MPLAFARPSLLRFLRFLRIVTGAVLVPVLFGCGNLHDPAFQAADLPNLGIQKGSGPFPARFQPRTSLGGGQRSTSFGESKIGNEDFQAPIQAIGIEQKKTKAPHAQPEPTPEQQIGSPAPSADPDQSPKQEPSAPGSAGNDQSKETKKKDEKKPKPESSVKNQNPPGKKKTEKNTPPATKPPAQAKQPESTNYKAALWAHLPNTRLWTDTVVAGVRANLDRLERARDKHEFCPGYKSATRLQRETCWLVLIGAIARFESSFNPNDGFVEPDGSSSIGLLSLSINECPDLNSQKRLKDPVRNLRCGIQIMARLIAAHGFIDGPPSSRGAAAYWSVLREPYTYGRYKLGKKHKIISLTRNYKKI